MDSKTIRYKNARMLVRECGGISAFADKLGKQQSQVSAIAGENPIKGIGPKIARQIESAFRKPEGWMDVPQWGMSNVVHVPPQPATRMAPVISWVQAGAWNEAADPFPPGTGESWEPVPETASPHAFWLRVIGDSMTAPSSPSIPEGTLILVDPDVHADNGRLVIAKLIDSDEVTFKKLVIDAGHKYLKPLNPAYPVIEINGNCKIVGVITEAKIKF